MTKNFMRRVHRPVTIGCALMFSVAAVRIIWVAAVQDRNIFTPVILSLLMFGLAFGLLRQFRWAFRTTAAVVLLNVIVLPAGLFNPFTAGDYVAAGKNPPSVITTLFWLIPLEAFLLTILFILDPRGKTRKVHKLGAGQAHTQGKLSLFLIIVLVISIPTILQAKDDNGKYIKEIFRSEILDLPPMAWIVYPTLVFSEKKFDRLFVYSGSVFEASFDKICLDSEIRLTSILKTV